jgi:malonate decarboxylase delta subunit
MNTAVGIETMQFEFRGQHQLAPFPPVLVGVVSSGNLEVLIEAEPGERCTLNIQTSARGFRTIWQAVAQDFHDRHQLAGVTVSIHDMGATPAVVNLRLDQAVASLPSSLP